MSVINTNITSMIGQSNLSKSQSALQTSMERLSSGLRINSAKDDAAGQAIANRMTAQINGLAQAQRNANDGISIAQTAEGGLNQINDNLQRIRELTVQAANGTNSSSDLQSIQDEVNQRLEEINRISRETDFNGTRVLSEDAETLTIQVGSQDGQTISVNLTAINAQELGLADFNVNGQVRNAVADATALEAAGFVTNNEGATFEGTVNRVAAEADLTALATSGELTELTAGGFVATANAEFENDPATVENFVAAADADTANITIDGTEYLHSTAGEFTQTQDIGTAAGASSSILDTFDFDSDPAARYELSIDTDNTTGPVTAWVDSDGYLWDQGTAGSRIEIADNGEIGGTSNPVDATLENVIGEAGGSIAFAGTTEATYGEVTYSNVTAGDFERVETFDTAAMEGLVAAGGSATATIGTADYSVDADGNVSVDGETAYWDAGATELTADAGNITAVAGADVYSVDATTGDVTVSDDDGVTTEAVFFDAEAEGLAALTTDDGGELTYFAIEDSEGNFVEYNTADDGTGDTAFVEAGTTNLTTEEFGLDENEVTQNPLAALDTALNQVDSLRSELGAVQNRFEDAITNLSTNETNLAAARSRIEDADYAVEVADMTRAQILQQAGTSVLAQANQIPQNVLSLLG